MKIKPCPFCGGKQPRARKLPPVRDQQVDAWIVDCPRLKCLASGPLAEGTRDAAIAAWNERPAATQPADKPPSDALREETKEADQ